MRKLSIIALVALSFGCVTTTNVPSRAAEPKMMVAAAHERGAATNPEAQLHLKLAEDRIAQAERYLRAGEEREANLLLLRAEADAEYALALLRRDDAREKAESIQLKIDGLHREMQGSEG